MDDNQAKTELAAAIAHENLPARPTRASYASPMLHIYGSVSRLTTAKTIAGTDGTGHLPGSDRTIKENIVRIGDHPLGIGLYLFDYKPEYRDVTSHDRQLGVMADEVETVMPEAVFVHPDGYKTVDYAMLNSEQARHALH